MHIVFPVNQRQAIRRGFNAPSTFKYDLDIASLTEAERYALSLCFEDGRVDSSLTINEPTEAGVRDALRRFALEVDAFRSELEQRFSRKEVEGPRLFGDSFSPEWQRDVRQEWEQKPEVKAWLDEVKKT